MYDRKFKLIALDIDGTLITGQNTLTKRTKKALRDAMDKGFIVTIATGRFYPSACRIARKLPVNAPIVCNDGALIKDVFSDNTIYFKPLPLKLALEILELVSRFPTLKARAFMEHHQIYAGENLQKWQFLSYFRFRRKRSLKGLWNYVRDFVLVPVKNAGDIDGLKDILKSPPAKIFISGEGKQIEEFSRQITTHYNEEIFLTTALKNCVDIINGEASKAKGLAVLAQSLGIKREERIAFGDNINDMKMLEYAGLGVAMANAPRRVREIADHVTASNNEDGIAVFLEQFLQTGIIPDKSTPGAVNIPF
jgi:Cof subfamily protein (haloacid dehalogenase superfamily)